MFGPFQVLGQLGQGGMGTVFHAIDTRTGHEVALKLPDHELTAVRAERFRREGETTASLQHPGIVRILDFGVVGGRPYLAYELVNRCLTAGDHLPSESVRRRVELVRDAARALGHAHHQGVTHRDVKPDNLLIDANGRLKVADFGLALDATQDRMTRTGATVGTPYYMPPEQATGKRDLIGPASDVWSLGVVLYEVLAGEVPFKGTSMVDLARVIVAARYRPLREVAPEVPKALEAVCARCLKVNPAERYPNGDALANDLDAYLQAPITAARGPGVWIAVAGVLTLGVLGAAVTLAQGPSGAAAPADPAVAQDAPTPGPAAPTPAPSVDAPPAVDWPTLPQAPTPEPVGARWLDAERALTWSAGGVTLWEVTRGAPQRRWEDLGPLSAFTLRADKPDVLVASGNDVTALGVESGTRQGLTSMLAPRAGVFALAIRVWSDGANVIAKGGADHTDVQFRASAKSAQTISRILNGERCLALDALPDSPTLVVVTDAGVRSVPMSDVNDHQTYAVSGARCLRVAPGGQRFAVGTEDGEVHVFAVGNPQPILSARAGHGPVHAVDFGDEGDLLSAVVAGDAPAWVRWRFSTPAAPPTVVPCPGEPTSLALSPSGERALIGNAAGQAWVAALE